jgi:predicted nucleic acid-binding protein
MIVVDTNILVYALMASDKTDAALAVEAKDADWVMPSVWRHEFINVLCVSAGCGRIELEDARSVWARAESLMEDFEQPVDFKKTLALATAHEVTGYDAQFVLLAQTLGVPLVTEDKELLRKFPGFVLSMKDFTA